MNYLLHLVTIFGITAMQVAGLSLVAGLAGVLALDAGLLVAVGAYTYAIATVTAHWPPFLACLVALGVGTLAGICSGALAFRLSGESLVLGTLALQLIGTTAIANLDRVTGGAYGFSGIRRPVWDGVEATNAVVALVVVCIGAIVLAVIALWYHSPFARVLRACRDTPLELVLLGRSLARFRFCAFVCAGAVLGVTGALGASYATYIDPSTGDLNVSISLLTAVILGGAGRLRGAIAGAGVVTLVPEVLRFVGTTPATGPALQLIVYGVLLALCMWRRPAGMFGEHAFRSTS